MVVVVGLGALVVVVVGLGALVVVVVALTADVVVPGWVVAVPPVVVVVGLVVAVVEDTPAPGRRIVVPDVRDALKPAVLLLLEAATAGATEVGADDEPGTWPEAVSTVGSGTELVPWGAVVPWPEPASAVVVVVWALVATPAIEATTTATTRTTPMTSAERSRVAPALSRDTGRARNRVAANWRLASERRRREDSRLTLGLARRGWPTGAKAPSISIVS